MAELRQLLQGGKGDFDKSPFFYKRTERRESSTSETGEEAATIDFFDDFSWSPVQRVNALKEMARLSGVDAKRLKLIGDVTSKISAAHMATCEQTADKVADGFRQYQENGSPTLPPMPAASGKMDPSNMSAKWDKFFAEMVPVIKRVMNFFQQLPGVSCLTLEDKIKLMQQGSFEVIMACYSPMFCDDGVFVPTMEYKIPRRMLSETPMGAFFEQMYEFADAFNPLKLSDAETAILLALMIVNPDRVGLQDRTEIFELQRLYVQSFLHLILKTRPDTGEEIFAKAVNTLLISNRLSQNHLVALNKIKSHGEKFAKLHEELFHTVA